MLAPLLALALQVSDRFPDLDDLSPPTLYQIGSFRALAAGQYDGTEPIKRLLDHGNFGVGTFNGLDGEMIVVDGKIYHANAYGDLDVLPGTTKTPFACVVRFETSTHWAFARPLNSQDVQNVIDRMVPQDQKIVAIRIDGTFTEVKTRAYPPQLKPYLPFAKLKDAQSVFSYPSVKGTFVGFRMPKDIGSINVPGYHFHFVSEDRKHGGHVLSFSLQEGTIGFVTVNRKIVGI